jgi:hypothetical protein
MQRAGPQYRMGARLRSKGLTGVLIQRGEEGTKGQHTGKEDVPPIFDGHDVCRTALEHRHIYRLTLSFPDHREVESV